MYESEETLIPDEQEVIPLLKDFGLAQDEARVYVGLLRMGSGKVSEISHFTNTDRVKGYKILETLRNQGFVTSTLSSPILFSANEPKLIFDEILKKKKSKIGLLEKNHDRLIHILENLKGRKAESNLPKLTVISGRDNIYDQIKKIIDDTNDELYLVSSVADLIRMYYTDIPEALKKASKRNVIVKLMTELEITTKLECVKRLGINYFKIARLPSHGRIICNTSQVLMSGYTSSTSSQNTSDDSALVTNSDEIRGNMLSLCKFMWKIGKELRANEKISNENPNQSNKSQKQTTALVVDDDPDAVEMFSDYLEIKGIKIIGKCKDGKEGFESYKKLNPDVVFLDIMMPDYDGFYALQKIREVKSDAKVIMVTADMSSETKKKLREMKPTDVIYKPYNVEKILDNLE